MATRTVRVTIEKEIEITIPDHKLTKEFQQDFENGLWDYSDDADKYPFLLVARNVAVHDGIQQVEGMGRVQSKWSSGDADIVFNEFYEDVEAEFIDGGDK